MTSDQIDSGNEAGAPLLAGLLRRIRRRVVADRFLRNASVDLGVSISLLAVLIVLDRVLFPGLVTASLAGTVLLVSIAVSLARTALLSPLDLFRTALLADSRLRLKERVSSAVYLAQSEGGPEASGRGWERLLAIDAARSLSGIRIDESFPVRPPRRALAWLAVAAAACAVLGAWFPAFDVLGIHARKEASAKAKASVVKEEKKLAESLGELVKKADDPELRKLLDALARQALEPRKETPAGEKQKTEPGSGDPKKEALVSMTRTEDEIKKGLEGKKFEPLKDAERALKSLDLKDADLTRKLTEALKDGDFEKAKREMEAIRKELADLAAKKPSDLTPEEKAKLEKLGSELRKLSSDSKSLSKLSSALSKASSGLGSKDFQGALDSLSLSSEELESLSRLASEMDVLDQALELVKLSKEELESLQSCPECGTPYCKDCGKPQCPCKPGNKPGGT